MSPQLRRTLRTSSLALRIALALVAFAGLFVTSWMIYVPVVALLFTPISLLASWLLSDPPSPLANSMAAVTLSGALAGATVVVVFRVLVARARRRRAEEPPHVGRPTGSWTAGTA